MNFLLQQYPLNVKWQRSFTLYQRIFVLSKILLFFMCMCGSSPFQSDSIGCMFSFRSPFQSDSISCMFEFRSFGSFAVGGMWVLGRKQNPLRPDRTFLVWPFRPKHSRVQTYESISFYGRLGTISRLCQRGLRHPVWHTPPPPPSR